MSEEDLKSVIATYQQKAFELFNSNIVLETQITSLQKRFEAVANENAHLKSHIEGLSAQQTEEPVEAKKRASRTSS